MANHKSAEKRARQNEKRRIRNKSVKTGIKHVTQSVRLAAEGASKDTAATDLKSAQSMIDKATKKGIVHKRTAARKISRLSKLVNSAGA